MILVQDFRPNWFEIRIFKRNPKLPISFRNFGKMEGVFEKMTPKVTSVCQNIEKRSLQVIFKGGQNKVENSMSNENFEVGPEQDFSNIGFENQLKKIQKMPLGDPG